MQKGFNASKLTKRLFLVFASCVWMSWSFGVYTGEIMFALILFTCGMGQF